MEETKIPGKIDVIEVGHRLKNKKKLLLKAFIISLVLSYLLILPIPRYYTCDVSLAPEIPGGAMGNNQLSSLASSFGFGAGNALTGDAIYPELYPDVLKSNDFILTLVDVPVVKADNTVKTDYYTYLKKHQRENPYTVPFGWVKRKIKGLFVSKPKEKDNSSAINPFKLTEGQSGVFGRIRDNISCDVDMKTQVITITVKDQDPLVAATMANTVREKLQAFITRYRTNKARIDVEYYKKLTAEAKHKYEKARQLYGSYGDANTDVILPSYRAKQEDLENDMQLKYNAYTTLNAQLLQAQAKVQEKTPAFTVVKAASVPLKPAGPKRMAFVVVVVLFVLILSSIYVNRDLFIDNVLH